MTNLATEPLRVLYARFDKGVPMFEEQFERLLPQVLRDPYCGATHDDESARYVCNDVPGHEGKHFGNDRFYDTLEHDA